MLVVVSPAKKLDFESETTFGEYSQPALLAETELLAGELKQLSLDGLKGLMKASDKISEQAYRRFQDFSTPFDLGNAKQAIFAFRGDTYLGLDADTLEAGDLEFAQGHFRILSGLYGVLRPLDLMQAYRLEMGAKFKNRRGRDLYAFWGGRIVDEINASLNGAGLNGAGEPVIVNCASNEYFKSLKAGKLEAPVITPQFKEVKNGVPRVLSMFAKRARGLMARYVIRERITEPEALLDFNLGGYKYAPEHSSFDAPVFMRPQPRPKG